MCLFKTKEGKRILNSRKYVLAGGHRFIYFKAKRDELVIDLTNKGGDIKITLEEDKKEVASLDNPVSNTYRFPLVIGKKYKIDIRLHKHVGGYKIST